MHTGAGLGRVCAGHGSDAGQKLLRGKRLCQVIVSSGVQTVDLILNLGFCRKQKHRCGNPQVPQFFQHSDPVHYIQDQWNNDFFQGSSQWLWPGIFHLQQVINASSIGPFIAFSKSIPQIIKTEIKKTLFLTSIRVSPLECKMRQGTKGHKISCLHEVL